MRLLEYLEAHPIIEVNKTSEALELSFNTTAKAIKRLIDLGILVSTKNISRNRIFAYKEYLDILSRNI